MLFPKKGQLLLRVYEAPIKEVNGIAIPQIAARLDTPKFQVMNFPFGTGRSENLGLHVGSVVVLQNLDKISTVKLSFNGILYYTVNVEDVVAEFPDLSEFRERAVPLAEQVNDLPDDADKFKASGDSFIIAPFKKLDFTEVNGIIIPMKDRELQRSHVGIVISVGAKAQEKTGFKAGQVIIYDYYGAFGHEWKYDAVRSENVLAALSTFGYKKMLKHRQAIEEKAGV